MTFCTLNRDQWLKICIVLRNIVLYISTVKNLFFVFVQKAFTRGCIHAKSRSTDIHFVRRRAATFMELTNIC